MITVQLPISQIIEWDIPNWSQVLPFWRHYLPPVSANPKILTLGERNGGLTLWLALQGYNVTYSDIVQTPVSARELHEKFGVANLIEYSVVDVFKIPFDTDSFDIVLAKSMLGGVKLDYSNPRTRNLENQKLACEEIRRVLKPNGFFLGAENTRGNLLHQFQRAKLGKIKSWRYLSQADIQYMFTEYSKLTVKGFGLVPSSSPYPFLNAFIGFINKPLAFILPNKWQYISFISARK